MKILALDDDRAVLVSTVFYLEDEGYDVISAESAEDALDLLDAEAPDIALVDMRLPGMDGNDFIREAAKKLPDLQYIVMTGSSVYEVPKDLQELGVCDDTVLKKPLNDMAKITEVIDRLLGT